VNIAIIPVKVWGSKGLPGKFEMIMAGKPMWQWVTEAAIDCNYIDEVYMTGNKKEHKEFYPRVKPMYPKVKWITRPETLQKNGVELLEVMQYCLKKVGKKGDVFIQLQATKPMTTSKLLNEIINKYNENIFTNGNRYCLVYYDNMLSCLRKYNSLFTAVKLGYIEILELLIELGGDINIKDGKGKTLLMGACAKKNIEMIKYLLSIKFPLI
jgi:hypothetical protein